MLSQHHIISDGIFRPFSVGQASDYFMAMGFRNTPILYGDRVRLNEGGVAGISLNGDLYFGTALDDYTVIGQSGSEHATINAEAMRPMRDEDTGGRMLGPMFAVHPNGDFWAMYALIKEGKAYFYRLKRNWGTDYIALAKEGVAADAVVATRTRLRSFNNPELRIVRNAFFALQGYDFQSWEMKTYFNGFDWYESRPDVQNDPATLTDNQRRLLDLVVAEEADRQRNVQRKP